MASAITHFVVGAALALPAIESAALRGMMSRSGLVISAGLLAVAPDLDTPLMRVLRLPYDSFLGHRGFFHSPFFLILLSMALAASVSRRGLRTWGLLAVVWGVSAISHPLLDMLTDGGLGVMALFPFSDERLFFPWRPIRVSPLGMAAFFRNAGSILKTELPFCLASLAIGFGLLALRKSRVTRLESAE